MGYPTKMKVLALNAFVFLPSDFKGTFADALKYWAELEEKSKFKPVKVSTKIPAPVHEHIVDSIGEGRRSVCSYGLTNFELKEGKWHRNDALEGLQ